MLWNENRTKFVHGMFFLLHVKSNRHCGQDSFRIAAMGLVHDVSHKSAWSRAAMFAPSIAQPNPNDNHDTMCADWQGTRLAVNSCSL